MQGKRREEEKGEKKGRKWEVLGVTNGDEPRRWLGKIPREPVLRSTARGSREQEGQVQHGEVCGM